MTYFALRRLNLITLTSYPCRVTVFLSQERKQAFIRKSGGIGIFFRNRFESKIKIIETDSDYIFWLRLDKSLFSINEDLILGILYIPPSQSRFLNDDEYFNLEMEITSMCMYPVSVYLLDR